MSLRFDVHAGTHLDSVLSTPSGVAAADLTPVFEDSAVHEKDNFGANGRPVPQPEPEPEPESEPPSPSLPISEAHLNAPDQLHVFMMAATAIQSYWRGHSCRQARTMELLHRERSREREERSRLRKSKASVGTG